MLEDILCRKNKQSHLDYFQKYDQEVVCHPTVYIYSFYLLMSLPKLYSSFR